MSGYKKVRIFGHCSLLCQLLCLFSRLACKPLLVCISNGLPNIAAILLSKFLRKLKVSSLPKCPSLILNKWFVAVNEFQMVESSLYLEMCVITHGCFHTLAKAASDGKDCLCQDHFYPSNGTYQAGASNVQCSVSPLCRCCLQNSHTLKCCKSLN